MYPKNYWEINMAMYNTCLFKVSEMEHISSGKHQNRIHVTCLHVQTIKRMRRTQKMCANKGFQTAGVFVPHAFMIWGIEAWQGDYKHNLTHPCRYV